MHTIESQLSLAMHVRSQTGSRRLVLALGVLLFTLTACAKDRTATDTSAAAERRAGSTDTASLSGMKGMSGDSGGMGAMKGMSGMMSMMGAMRKQMDGMMKASPDHMKAMTPAHRQMAANMLVEMNAEMRTMNMSGDAAWTATVDSIRQDLVHMPELNGREMMVAMPAHHTRMVRLMDMHQAMTKNMNM